METKKERLMSAFNYLKGTGKVHTQQDIADKMEINKSSLSKATNGDDKYLTDSFLKRFNYSFGNLFNERWLISGDGEMLNQVSQQIVNGDNNTAVSGNGNTVNTITDALLNELVAQRRMTEKAQQQIDRMLTIIENINKP